MKVFKKLAIVLIGRSGAGKGTQAKLILRRLKKRGVVYIETGEEMRKITAHSENYTVRLGRSVMSRGGLMPAWFPAYVWLKGFIEGGNGGKHIVFDGASRRLWEAELLDEVLRWHSRPLPLALYIDVTRKEAYRRLLLRKRPDDAPAAIKNRLQFFDRDVAKVLHYYRRHKRLLRVDGNPPPDVVWSRVDHVLAKRLGRLWPVKP